MGEVKGEPTAENPEYFVATGGIVGEFARLMPSIKPTDWVPLKVFVRGAHVVVFAGAESTPTMEVRKLGGLMGGMVGLWVGNGSDGDFANLRIAPAK